jgi:hypothetical protein
LRQVEIQVHEKPTLDTPCGSTGFFTGLSATIEILAFQYQNRAKEVNCLFVPIISYRFSYYWNDSGKKKARKGLCAIRAM